MGYYIFTPCELHQPPASELLLPNGSTELKYYLYKYNEVWSTTHALAEEHDRILQTLACAKFKLSYLFKQPDFTPFAYLGDLKQCSDRISALTLLLSEVLAKLKAGYHDMDYDRYKPGDVFWFNHLHRWTKFIDIPCVAMENYRPPTKSSYGEWVSELQIPRIGCQLPFKTYRKQKRQRRSNKTRRRIMVLPGLINGSKVSALPDTGAGRNMMSERFARSQKIQVRRGPESRSTYKLANGRSVRSRGIAVVRWKFGEKEVEEYKLEFHILPDCVYDVIIGQEFLEASDTLSANRHRLQLQESTPRDVRYVNLCGSPCQTLLGFIDGEPIGALPDTGSEVNIMSELYAERRGYKINKIESDMDELQFADGSSQRTIGKIDARWAFNDDPGGSVTITFEILSQCPYEVIIGQNILYDHDVYNKHTACLVKNVADKRKELPLNYAGWRASFLELLKPKKQQCESNRQFEVTL